MGITRELFPSWANCPISSRGVPVKDDLVKNSGVHFGSGYVVGVQLMYDSTQLVYTAESVILYSHSNEVFG